MEGEGKKLVELKCFLSRPTNLIIKWQKCICALAHGLSNPSLFFFLNGLDVAFFFFWSGGRCLLLLLFFFFLFFLSLMLSFVIFCFYFFIFCFFFRRDFFSRYDFYFLINLDDYIFFLIGNYFLTRYMSKFIQTLFFLSLQFSTPNQKKMKEINWLWE